MLLKAVFPHPAMSCCKWMEWAGPETGCNTPTLFQSLLAILAWLFISFCLNLSECMRKINVIIYLFWSNLSKWSKQHPKWMLRELKWAAINHCMLIDLWVLADFHLKGSWNKACCRRWRSSWCMVSISCLLLFWALLLDPFRPTHSPFWWSVGTINSTRFIFFQI